MHRHTPSLLTRLRRQRGLWVLALAVLLFKVTMSTFCVLDGPRVAFIADTATAIASVAAADPADADGDLCVLNEGKGCHCTCAHAVAMPAHTTAVPAVALASRVEPSLPDAASPAFARSPLRPPIS